jgi:hypothetical protein
MKGLLVIFFLFEILSANAQQADTFIRQDNSLPSTTQKKNFAYYFAPISLRHAARSKKIDFQIDTRNSFVKDFPINVYGVNLGVVVRERFRWGAGYYWINQSFNDKLLGIYATNTTNNPDRMGRVIMTSKGVPVPISTLEQLVAAGKISSSDYLVASQHIDLWFASVGFMYTFYASRLVEFAIPIEIGYGGFEEKLYDISGNDFASIGSKVKPQPTTGNFFPGQIGFNVLLKPHRWFYLEGSYGYRQTISQNYTTKSRATSFDSQFNGEYYNVGLKIQLGTLLKEWKRWKKNKAAKNENH